MSHRPNVPQNMEIWTGSPKGLRLRKHPRLKDALEYLYEASMVIRKPAPIGRTQLTVNSKPQIRLGSLPVFVHSSVGQAVHLRLELDIPELSPHHAVQLARVFIQTDDTILEEHMIVRPGKEQVILLPFPAFDKPTRFTVSVELRQRGETGKAVEQFELQPEKRLTFYYAFQTHLDLGWTDRVKPVIQALRKMTLQTAIDVCSQFMHRPEGERFIWTCECSDALRFAWEGANETEREKLRQMVKLGLIQACAMPYSFHSVLMSQDLMHRAVRNSFALRREMGLANTLDLSVAQHNDVVGYNWSLPDILAQNGIHRMVMGHNHMIRGCTLPPLFHWQGPAGHSVLTLATSCVDYGTTFPIPQRADEFHALSANNPDASHQSVTAYLRVLGYGENCGPDDAHREINAVAAWNAQYTWPRLVIGSPKDYFNHIEQEVDLKSLPVVDREMSDWWIDGPASTPRAMAAYRKAMILLPELDKVIPDHVEEDRSQLADIERNLLLHAEHTFGLNAQLVKVTAANQNWQLDGMENYIGSWEDKEVYANQAWQQAQHLSQQYLYPANRAVHPNTHNWDILADEQGIIKLKSPDGTTWYDRQQNPSGPLFGCVVQRLMNTQLDEWFHHNPPQAPHPGDYPMTIQSVRPSESGKGITLRGTLNSPAGSIQSIQATFNNDPESQDLLIQLDLHNKQATAQAELLAMAMPFTVAPPTYRVDVGDKLMRVDADQLTDANRDEHPVITGFLITDTQSKQSLAISSAEVFLWHFGGLHYCKWNQNITPRNAHVYAHLFNNVWNTNFRCWIDGDLSYRFRIRQVDKEPLLALQQMASAWHRTQQSTQALV